MTSFISGTLPAKIIRTDGVTNLFQVAANEFGDATQWYRIAALNGLTDPWVPGGLELKIPAPGKSNGGIPNG